MDQKKLYVVPSKGFGNNNVFGDSAYDDRMGPAPFDTDLWKKNK